MIKYYGAVLILLFTINANCQSQKVLFLGNSYTGVNNVPGLIHNAANSVGDNLIFDQNILLGTPLSEQAADPIAISKINANDWDYVVLQPHDNSTSAPDDQLDLNLYFYVGLLCDSIRNNNSCTRPIIYQTWARSNGDPLNCSFYPPVCTYEGMDSLISLRCQTLSQQNETYVSPVGAVWRYIKTNHPSINLYAPDGAHPSQAGSYVAAITFYTMIFQKDPTAISFDYVLSSIDANLIKSAAKMIVFDNLDEWNIGSYDPVADFTSSQNEENFEFTNASIFSDQYQWDFGDDVISFEENPTHAYQVFGTYQVQLIATKCGISDTSFLTINYQPNSNNNIVSSSIQIYPNPSTDILVVEGVLGNYQVKLLDTSGSILQALRGENLLEINMSDLPNGLYFLQIEQNGKVIFVSKQILKME